MYEVFLNERKIVITTPGNTLFVKEAVITENLKSVAEVETWFLDFVTTEKKLAVLLHPLTELFWNELFLPVFKSVPAAGGIVIRNDKLLFICRNGKWDLPKGKIDSCETAEEAAIREVSEECGISGHQITKTLQSTFHIFKSPYKESLGKWILKDTSWFEMNYQGNENGTPQTDENISEVRWFEKNKLDEVLRNTYENLKPVIALYKK